MPIVALAESYHEHPDTQGTFPIQGNKLPGGWGPAPIAEPAFPTPFARAEAMRQVLAAIDATDSGNTATHPLANRFRQLLIGTAAGLLVPRVVDLNNDLRYDNFGQALLRSAPEARYIVELAEFDPQQPGSRGLVFGYSHPDCLFWPHARRVESEWTRLNSRLGAQEASALLLLREWQHALTQVGMWDDAAPQPWQRGAMAMLKDVNLDPKLTRLHEDCRFVGPIVLTVTGTDGKAFRTPIYFPLRSDGFANQFVRRCDLQPNLRGTVIALGEGASVHVRIAMPEPECNATRIELGSGVVELVDAGPLPPPAQNYCFEELPKLLGSVNQALLGLDPPRRIDIKSVERCPALYPDPIRILVHRNLWRSSESKDAIPTAHYERRSIRSGGDRIPSFASLEDDAEALIVVFGDDALTQRRMQFVERNAGMTISDLSALGACLYLAFIGEATLAGRDLRDNEERSLLVTDVSRPLEASAAAHEQLDIGLGRARKRLATLQRFVSSYSSGKDLSTRPEGGVTLPILLGLSARAFAKAAVEKDVLACGRRAVDGAVYELANGQKVVLLKDALENGAG